VTRILLIFASLTLTIVGLILFLRIESSPAPVPLNIERIVPTEDVFSEESYLGVPMCIDISSDTIFVADSERDEIVLFDTQGEYLGTIGGRGHGPGEFNSLRALKVDTATSRLFVLDNLRVSLFTTDGKFLNSFVNPPATSLDVLPNGQILLCARARNDRGSLSVFDTEGELQTTFSPLSDLIAGDSMTLTGAADVLTLQADTITCDNDVATVSVTASGAGDFLTLQADTITFDNTITGKDADITGTCNADTLDVDGAANFALTITADGAADVLTLQADTITLITM